MSEILFTVSTWVLPLLFAITFHEAAHGWVADKLGDDTARRMGRVTFNPLRHIDRFGTIILPGLLLLLRAPFVFGYAKPVPVNFARLREPKRDMIWVALAGPGANIALALACGVLLHATAFLPAWLGGWLEENLVNGLIINAVLAVFNMLPLPPLDGGRVLTGLLPRPLAWRFARIERYGMLILFAILFIVPWVSRQFGMGVNPLIWLMGPPVDFVLHAVFLATGHV